MSKTADTAERMVLRIMAYVFNKECGKKWGVRGYSGQKIFKVLSGFLVLL